MQEPPKKDSPPPSTGAGEQLPPEGDTSPWKTGEDGKRTRKGRKLPYEAQIHQLLLEVSGAVALADSFSAKAIELKSEELAYGYARLAKEDPRVKALFERLVTGTALSAVVIPTVSLVAMIGWHFGFVPSKVGVPVTLANGMIPFTREQERAAKEQAAQGQAEAQARATHPNGEAPGAGGDTPQ
jgi:hypothetical protein